MKYILILIINGDSRHEERMDVFYSETEAAESFARLLATYDDTHQAAVIETARHEPNHFYGTTIKYAACSGKIAWLDNQYA